MRGTLAVTPACSSVRHPSPRIRIGRPPKVRAAYSTSRGREQEQGGQCSSEPAKALVRVLPLPQPLPIRVGLVYQLPPVEWANVQGMGLSRAQGATTSVTGCVGGKCEWGDFSPCVRLISMNHSQALDQRVTPEPSLKAPPSARDSMSDTDPIARVQYVYSAKHWARSDDRRVHRWQRTITTPESSCITSTHWNQRILARTMWS